MLYAPSPSSYDPRMPDDTKILLKEIRALATVQQQILEEVRARPTTHARWGKAYWKYITIVSIITLGAGSYASYQYYKILRSIIDQFPQ